MHLLPRKDMKGPCQQDLGSLAVRLSSWLADIRQRPPQSVFWTLSGCIHQLKWDGTGRERVSVPLSILSEDAGPSAALAHTKAVLFLDPVSIRQTGGRCWRPTVTAPVTAALTESYRLRVIVVIKPPSPPPSRPLLHTNTYKMKYFSLSWSQQGCYAHVKQMKYEIFMKVFLYYDY